MEEIIDLARWTPSGDNSQPWRFVVTADDRLEIHIEDAGQANVYEYRNGQPTLISAGMLLASLQIAASRHRLRMEWVYAGKAAGSHRIDARFVSDRSVEPDRLWSAIPLRAVDRRPYRSRPLRPAEKAALESALGPGLEIAWFEGARKIGIAGLNGMATDIRLRIPETFEIHRRILDWDRKFSPDRMPAAALGLDRPTLTIMRWAMGDKRKLDRLNALLGTAAARLQMDYLPGLFCAAHFSIQADLAENGPARIEQLLKLGQSLQRFWLTATELGLAMQPSLAPLAFLNHIQSGVTFTSKAHLQRKGARRARRAAALLPQGGARTVFLGRIGEPGSPLPARSIRLPFEALILNRPD
jgi:nitroreductase